MKYFSLFIALFTLANLSAQSDQVMWQKTLGGSNHEEAYKIKTTLDGGYIVCGYTLSTDGDVHDHYGNFFKDAWFVRLDSNGDTLWTHAYGGVYDEIAMDIIELSDGSFMSAVWSQASSGGDITNPLGSDDYWVVKLDANGVLVWEKTFGGTSSDIPSALVQTFDGNFVVGGYSSSVNGDISSPVGTSGTDAWLVKFDGSGNLIWDKSLGGTDTDNLYMLKQTSDSGFIMAGVTWSFDVAFTVNQGLKDAFLMKTDSLGNLEWGNTYGGAGYDNAYDVVETFDGNYIVAGGSNSSNGDFPNNNGSYDVFFMKINNVGVIKWVRNYGGSTFDFAYGLIETLTHNYTSVGYTASSDGDVSGGYLSDDLWMLNFDINGNLIWENSFGGDSLEAGYSIAQNTDGTYAVSGYTNSNEYDVSGVHGTAGKVDFWVMKLDCAPPVTQEICLVTVDSSSTKNIVVWEKPLNNIAIDSFYVYRDVVGLYTKVGAVAYNDLSQFEDTTNGINPNITSYRYKVSSVDTCGVESPLGNFHETIHLTANLGLSGEVNLIWDNYEGFVFTYYRIWRDDFGNGNNWNVIDSLTSANNTYTDLNPPSQTVGYMIEVIPPSTCTSTKAQDHNSTRSNRSTVAGTPPDGISELNDRLFSVYPNPTEGKIVVQQNGSGNSEIWIKDIGGKIVQNSKTNQANITIDITNFDSGIYFLTITQGDYSQTQKVIKK